MNTTAIPVTVESVTYPHRGATVHHRSVVAGQPCRHNHETPEAAETCGNRRARALRRITERTNP